MVTYKLFRLKGGELYPLFVECSRKMPIGVWLDAGIGELADETHVRSRLGPLALRPGFHSTEVPFTDWIGKKDGDRLVQRKGTVWCECEVQGREQPVKDRHGLKALPSDWYYYRTKPGQLFPWIISNRIRINRILEPAEVESICLAHGVQAQKMEE